jgi:hypothetical protein
LESVALVRHADRDPADAGPGVEPGPQCPERAGLIGADELEALKRKGVVAGV